MGEKTRAKLNLHEELEYLRRRVAELSALEEELGRTVERLRSSEEMYRALVEISPAAITVTDLEGKITHVSKITLEIHGFDSAAEMRGISAFDLIAPEHRERAAINTRQTLDEGAVEDIEYTMLRKDGSSFVAELSASVVRDSDGNPHAFIGMTRNITERREMENALRASEERYRDLVENVNDAIYLVDLAGIITYISPAVESILGYKPSEAIGRRITEFAHPDDAGIALRHIKEVLDGCLTPNEIRCITRSGEVKWVRTSSKPVHSEGKAVGVLGVMTDVTEHKEAEKQVAFLGSIIERLKDAVVVTDLENKILYINDAAECLFGYAKEELLGNTPDILNAEPMAESIQKEICETVSSGRTWESTIMNRRKDGSIFSNEMRVSPLRDEDGNVRYYIGIQRDVTDKKHLEQELLQAQKMEAVGTMAGGIAHDFNNLLTAIIGYSELLLAACEPGSVMRKDVEEIGKTARRASTLTRQLLSFGRRQMMQVAPIDLSIVVSGLDKMLRRLISEDIELTAELSPDLDRVEADAGQIEQVIMNLVLNSRDAMPGGGKLSVRTENVLLDDEYCRGKLGARPGSWVKLTVTDNGGGMDSAVAEHIFEPFYTTKDVGRGSGLGLSVVYGIVRQHKGWIDVVSEPGKGSSFGVYLPTISRRAEEDAIRQVADLEVEGGGKRVLLVEDQEEVRRLAERALKNKGYVVLCAADATEALEIFGKENGRFDLVFSDIVLPDKSGVELAERIRDDNAHIPILFTSGYTDQRLQWSVIEKRGYGFLKKPYELVELVQAVRDALAPAGGGSGKK